MKLAITIGILTGIQTLLILFFIYFQILQLKQARETQVDRIVLMAKAEKTCGTRVENFTIYTDGRLGVACSGELKE